MSALWLLFFFFLRKMDLMINQVKVTYLNKTLKREITNLVQSESIQTFGYFVFAVQFQEKKTVYGQQKI